MKSFPEISLKTIHIEEPALEFGLGQKTAHPKDGLFLYGPHNKAKRAKTVRIGVVGTADGLNHFKAWILEIKKGVVVPPPTKTEKANRLHLSNFRGLEETFAISIDADELVFQVIDSKLVDQKTRIVNHHEAVRKTVECYLEKVQRHRSRDERDIDIWVLVIPEIIYERCRPGSRRTGLPMEKGDFHKKQNTRSDLPLLSSIIDQSNEEIFDDAPDFHRQVKAAFLQIAPTQLLRETTIAPQAFLNKAGYPARKTQDRATVAWNLATGLYYKTQPSPPWKLSGIRPGVCYIGLVFKSLPNDPRGYACCAAQMFLSEGDGVVFRGTDGPWKTDEYEYHLERGAAAKLITSVINAYTEKHGTGPKELFVHGQTKFNSEEWSGFEEATPKGTKIVGVRIRTTHGETKLFRDGDYPVLRGTAQILDDRNANFWTTGYVPQLDTYIGPETPNPLFISILRSNGDFPDIECVLQDIIGLTKINYNSSNFNDGLPVTVRFAQMVGEVMTQGSAKGAERQQFKFYI